MGRTKGAAKKLKETTPLEDKLFEIEERFKNVPGTYMRFDKFIQIMQANYLFGSSEEIPALTQLFGKPNEFQGTYDKQWFVENMANWRIHYKSDLSNRYDIVITCVNAMSVLLGSGLQVRLSTIPNAGNGLFTTRSFAQGEILTLYGGYKSTLDVFECLDLPKEYRQYVLAKPGSDIVYDSQIGFSMGYEMGRWINHKKGYVNARFDFSMGDPSITATRDLKEGEELFLDYGPEFGLLEMCIQCKTKTTSVMCQACRGPICGNTCHEIHCREKH